MKNSYSNAVLSLSFRGPWILAGLRSGFVEIVKHRSLETVKSFAVHQAAVRSAEFHHLKPEFVSGGDDCNIQVWNYETDSCVLSLYGHRSSIRTVQFHQVMPWILSASEDRTIRIWNTQSKTCIAVLRGHKGPVMSALFHPRGDFIVSASLDKTLRVWDFSLLRKTKTETARNKVLCGIPTRALRHVKVPQVNIIEGHDGGVTWAAYHPNPEDGRIVSASMDQTVRIWHHVLDPIDLTFGPKTRVWSLWTAKRQLHGHKKAVSSAMFHPEQDVIVSSSEDSIKVWKRERPAFATCGDTVVYVHQQDVWLTNLKTANHFRRSVYLPTKGSKLSLALAPNLSLLVCSKSSANYALYKKLDVWRDALGKKHGTGHGAVFIGEKHFAVLTIGKREDLVTVRNLRNQLVVNCALPVRTTAIFFGGKGNLLCKSQDGVVLVDLKSAGAMANPVVLGELRTQSVKHVVWSDDMESVALLSKRRIIISSKTLDLKCEVVEDTESVKSGAWYNDVVFIYNTLDNIKYCLPSGRKGIIKALEVPIYITKVISGHETVMRIHYLEVGGEPGMIEHETGDWNRTTGDDEPGVNNEEEGRNEEEV